MTPDLLLKTAVAPAATYLRSAGIADTPAA